MIDQLCEQIANHASEEKIYPMLWHARQTTNDDRLSIYIVTDFDGRLEYLRDVTAGDIIVAEIHTTHMRDCQKIDFASFCPTATEILIRDAWRCACNFY